MIIFLQASLSFGTMLHFFGKGGFELGFSAANMCRRFSSTCSRSVILPILSPDEQSTRYVAKFNVKLVKLATSMSIDTLGRTFIIPFVGNRSPCQTTVSVESKWGNPAPLNTTLNVPIYFGFSHAYLATRSSTFVLVVGTDTGVSLEAVTATIILAASIVFMCKY